MDKILEFPVNDLIRLLRNISKKRKIKILLYLSSLTNSDKSDGYSNLCTNIRERPSVVSNDLKALDILSLIYLSGEGVKRTDKKIQLISRKPRIVKMTKSGEKLVHILKQLLELTEDEKSEIQE